jgi:hypothetical protein
MSLVERGSVWKCFPGNIQDRRATPMQKYCQKTKGLMDRTDINGYGGMKMWWLYEPDDYVYQNLTPELSHAC